MRGEIARSTTGEENGDLLIRTEVRKPTSSIVLYMFTKLLWTNPLTWMVLRIPFIRNRFFTRISLHAGDLMQFDGETTYHGNLAVSSGMRRSILIHHDPLFADSAITKLFHKINKLYLYKT